jgi:hypothetical protein
MKPIRSTAGIAERKCAGRVSETDKRRIAPADDTGGRVLRPIRRQSGTQEKALKKKRPSAGARGRRAPKGQDAPQRGAYPEAHIA